MTQKFETRKPTIVERIVGYFKIRYFNRTFAKAKAERAKLHEQMIAARVITLNS
jgi:hypothetical protein